MDIEELFSRLEEHQGPFPEDLVAELIERREEATPRLLSMLVDVDGDPKPWLENGGRMVHIYALYLLALFREIRAYPLLVRIFSRAGEFPFELAGDVVTQDLNRMLASVSGGDVSGMKALIENERANEYVRSAAMGAMVRLVDIGQRTRDEVIGYFVHLFGKLERKPGAHWDELANVCADLWPQEAMKELERAYEEGLVDPHTINWRDVERALALGKDSAMQERYRDPLITDLALDMRWMQCFAEQKAYYEEDFYKRVQAMMDGDSVMTPCQTAPKIGRNEACPCGSGRKYKKCCGGPV